MIMTIGNGSMTVMPGADETKIQKLIAALMEEEGKDGNTLELDDGVITRTVGDYDWDDKKEEKILNALTPYIVSGEMTFQAEDSLWRYIFLSNLQQWNYEAGFIYYNELAYVPSKKLIEELNRRGFDVTGSEDMLIASIRATDIDWDIDDDSDKEILRECLPKTVIVPDEYTILAGMSEDDMAETVGNWLSDTYEFCHRGFRIVKMTNAELKVEEEMLKRAVLDAGVDEVEEFLGHPLDNENDDIWAEMDDGIAQMPDEEYIKYLEKYSITASVKMPLN